jgi:N-acetylneuraminic acid mutarotase
MKPSQRLRSLRARPIVYVVVITSALTPFLSSARAAPSNTWTPVAPLIHPRAMLAAATGPDGRIYAIGGDGDIGSGVAFNEAYTPADDRWTERAPMPTPRRWLGAALGHDGRIYAAGGMNELLTGNEMGLNVVEAYNPQTDTWTTVAPMPTARIEFGLVTGNDGLIYAIGGCPGLHEFCTPVLGVVEAYNPATNTWTKKASMPTPRGGVAAALGPDGLIYAMGGLTVAAGPAVDTVEAYNPQTNTWKKVAPMPTARFILAATTGPDGRIYAIGGRFPGPACCDTGLDNVESYSTVSKTWTVLAPLPVPRFGPAASTSAAHVYSIGGACWTCPVSPNPAQMVFSYTPCARAGSTSVNPKDQRSAVRDRTAPSRCARCDDRPRDSLGDRKCREDEGRCMPRCWP